MKITLALIALACMAAVASAEIFAAAEAGVTAKIDSDSPLEIMVGSDADFAADAFLSISYDHLGEVSASGSIIADVVGGLRHSLPLADATLNAAIAAEITAESSSQSASGSASISFALTGQSQSLIGGGNEYDLFFVSFMGGADTTINSWELPITNSAGATVNTEVCLRGGSAGSCTDVELEEGNFEFAFGVNNWQPSSNNNMFRMGYLLEAEGMTDVEVYFNGDSDLKLADLGSTQIESVTFVGLRGSAEAKYTYTLQQTFNAGNDVFKQATITAESASSSSASGAVVVNVDIAFDDLETSASGTQWFVYDPSVDVEASGATALAATVLAFATALVALLY